MSHKYRIQVSETEKPEAGLVADFGIDSHDDLRVIFEKVGEKQIFTPEETTAFCLGLTLFKGAAAGHRDHALFSEFWPQVVEFMKKLRSMERPKE